MELICSESTPLEVDIKFAIDCGITFSAEDHSLLTDWRIVEQLLQTEHRYVPNGVLEAYKCTQREVEPYMRKIVANWMLEVCEEMNCEDVVFPVAMNFLDRFLVCTDIRKNQLQLVGVVCLLIASKLRQTQNLEPNILSFFTDYSVTVQEIIGWELLVLKRLKWDVSSVVAIDYLDYLLVRLSPTLIKIKTNKISSTSVDSIIRRHSSTFISLCTTELQFSCCLPSLIAAASIATAVKGLLRHNKSYQTFVFNLGQMIGSEPNRIDNCVEQIESLISSSTALTHKIMDYGNGENEQVERETFLQINTNNNNIGIKIVEINTI